MLALSGLREGFARGLVSLHTLPHLGPKPSSEEGFGPRWGRVCRETNPRANPSRKPLRASMAHSLALVTTSQLYSVVLGRFCAEKVTGGDRRLKVESQMLNVEFPE